MNERIKELRKVLGLSAEKFGEHIGITKSSISRMENGISEPTDSTIMLILKTSWNGQYVNEEWLRTGEGDMFAKLPEDNKLALSVKLIEKFPNVKRALEDCADNPEELYKALSAINQLLDKLYNKE